MARASAGVRSTSETVCVEGEVGVFAVEGAEERSESTDPEHAPSPMTETAVSTPSPTVRIRQAMSAPVRSLVDVRVLAGPTTVLVFADNSA